MRDHTIFKHQAQPDLSSSLPYRRLRAFGCDVGCTCEACFAYVERAISHYLPGFLPPDPLELENADLRAQNERLLRANEVLRANQPTAPNYNHSPKPKHLESRPAAFEPVVIR